MHQYHKQTYFCQRAASSNRLKLPNKVTSKVMLQISRIGDHKSFAPLPNLVPAGIISGTSDTGLV